MKRKIIMNAILFCFLFLFSSCGNTATGETVVPSVEPTSQASSAPAEPQETSEILEEYQNIGTWDDGYLFAIGYLGYYTEEAATEAANTYAQEHQLGEPDILVCDGMEGYVVVPKYPGTTITVKKYLNYEEKEMDLVAESEKTVILFCNPSDLYSNVEITVKYKDNTIVFSPYLNLQDGSLTLPQEAKNISVSQQDTTDEEIRKEMVGTWHTLDENGYYTMIIDTDMSVVIEHWMSSSEQEEPTLISQSKGKWEVLEDVAVLTYTQNGQTAQGEYIIQIKKTDKIKLLLTWTNGEPLFSFSETGDEIVFTQQTSD